MTRKDKQKRPTGVKHKVTEDFRARLTELLSRKEWTAIKLAEELTKILPDEYELDDSSISHLKAGRYPTSVLVEPICRMFDWPIPPPAVGLDERQEQWWEVLEKLKIVDPETYEVELEKFQRLLGRKSKRGNGHNT